MMRSLCLVAISSCRKIFHVTPVRVSSVDRLSPLKGFTISRNISTLRCLLNKQSVWVSSHVSDVALGSIRFDSSGIGSSIGVSPLQKGDYAVEVLELGYFEWGSALSVP